MFKIILTYRKICILTKRYCLQTCDGKVPILEIHLSIFQPARQVRVSPAQWQNLTGDLAGGRLPPHSCGLVPGLAGPPAARIELRLSSFLTQKHCGRIDFAPLSRTLQPTDTGRRSLGRAAKASTTLDLSLIAAGSGGAWELEVRVGFGPGAGVGVRVSWEEVGYAQQLNKVWIDFVNSTGGLKW